MVKRAAARHIGEFAHSVEKEYVDTELLPLFQKLSEDEQDSVRLLTIENCTAFAKRLDHEKNKNTILPMVVECAKDRSWRVRNNVAKGFYPVSYFLRGTRSDVIYLIRYLSLFFVSFPRLLTNPSMRLYFQFLFNFYKIRRPKYGRVRSRIFLASAI